MLSVLLPIWQEREHVATAVAAYRCLRYEPRELVLCAGGSDGTFQEASRHAAADVIVLEQRPGEGKQRALERCFAASHGDALFLTDADARPTAAVVEATLAPILNGAAEAATGPREPLPELRHLPLIAYQWAIESAGTAHIPDPSPGMLGSNAALTRRAAALAGSFAWAARTGTDYSLACRLRQAGISIRFVRDQPMPVGLATNVRDYSRQHARWLRNLVLVGRQYGDDAVVRQGLQPMVIGSLFVVLPFWPGPGRRLARSAWLALLLYAWWRRIGYVRAAPAEVRAVLTPRRWPLLGLYTLVDLLTWARAATECLMPAWRGRW